MRFLAILFAGALTGIPSIALAETTSSERVGDAAQSLFELGLKQQKGDGVRRNIPEAIKCFTRAASEGNADAEYVLGLIYSRGDGVPKDSIEGLARINIAAASGNEVYVKERDALESKLGVDAMLMAQVRSKLIMQSYERASTKTLPVLESRGLSGGTSDDVRLPSDRDRRPQAKVMPYSEYLKTHPMPKASAFPGKSVGIVGRDARWSEYGEYLNEMLQIVQRQWVRILDESRVSPVRGSSVVVTFRINSRGETDIVKVEDSNGGKEGLFSCQNAITYPQPYRKWSDQMVAAMGNSQEITLAFNF